MLATSDIIICLYGYFTISGSNFLMEMVKFNAIFPPEKKTKNKTSE